MIRISEIITHVTLSRGDEIINRKMKLELRKKKKIYQMNSHSTFTVTALRHTYSLPQQTWPFVRLREARKNTVKPVHSNLKISVN